MKPMKYEAINDWLVIEEDVRPQPTSSGFIVPTNSETAILKGKVIAAAGHNDKLLGKTVHFAKFKRLQFNQSDTVVYGGVKLEDVIAVVLD